MLWEGGRQGGSQLAVGWGVWKGCGASDGLKDSSKEKVFEATNVGVWGGGLKAGGGPGHVALEAEGREPCGCRLGYGSS